MKRILFSCLAFLLAAPSFGQADNQYTTAAATDITLFTPVDPALDAVGNATEVNIYAEAYFRQRVKQNAADPAAWFGFYKSVRYKAVAMRYEEFFQPQLDSIETQMQKHIAGTYEQLFVHYWNGHHDRRRFSSLQKAYFLNPTDPDLLRQMIGYEFLAGDLRKASELTGEWQKTGLMPSTLMPYAYNVLQSVPQNAVLLTNGEFDTFPLLRQQSKNSVRPDVKILSISLAKRSENRAELFRRLGLELPEDDSVSAFDADYIRRIAEANADKKIYLAATVGATLLGDLQNELFVTGLAFRYSGSGVDNLNFLRDNVGVKMKFDYLGKPVKDATAFDHQQAKGLNLNYVLPLVLAARQYEQAGNKTKAVSLREKARLIGAQAGKENEVEALIAP
jgi:hypothetical protein